MTYLCRIWLIFDFHLHLVLGDERFGWKICNVLKVFLLAQVTFIFVSVSQYTPVANNCHVCSVQLCDAIHIWISISLLLAAGLIRLLIAIVYVHYDGIYGRFISSSDNLPGLMCVTQDLLATYVAYLFTVTYYHGYSIKKIRCSKHNMACIWGRLL